MKTINKIGFDYETMSKNGEHWDSPEDIIHYVSGGLSYLSKTNDTTDSEVIEKRNIWIKYMKKAMDCLAIIE